MSEITTEIEALLAEAAEDGDPLDDLIGYLAALISAYETMRLTCEDNDNELGAAIYTLVRDEAHVAFHLALDHKKYAHDGEDDDND